MFGRILIGGIATDRIETGVGGRERAVGQRNFFSINRCADPMSTNTTFDDLRNRITAGYSLFALSTWEENRWEELFGTLAEEMDSGFVVWSLTSGFRPAWNSDCEGVTDAATMLDRIAVYPEDHVFLLYDLQASWQRPEIQRRIRDLSVTAATQNKILFVIGPELQPPAAIEKLFFPMALPLPDLEDMRTVWRNTVEQHGGPFSASETDEERLLQASLGLTAEEARLAFRHCLLGRSTIDDEFYATLIGEKRHLVSGSDFLEFYDLDDGIEVVGGLDSLKAWLRQRSQAFSVEAREQGIPLPKGMLLLGVQGCGKSLTARATASLLHFPLVRLDASHLLSPDQGESERNMQQVLSVLSAIAPVVLWIDELEKGFAGLGGDGGQTDATMARLFGQFLTWMEQRDSPVFVVATANSVEVLPPELLRKGRFDELFFVDLPNYHERQQIFRIHLERRGWNAEKFNLEELAQRSEGYSGAEIEQAVNSALIEAYTQKRIVTGDDVIATIEETVPLSKTMEEKVFALREWARPRCRPATPDSRVLQMLEEEDRDKGGAFEEEVLADDSAEWKTLAEYGQLRAAVVAFVSNRDRATFDELQIAFADHMPTAGPQGLALKHDPNAILCTGYSAELASLLVKIIAARRLYLHPGDVTDPDHREAVPDLPSQTSLGEERSPKPVWFPAYLTHFPPEQADPRLGRIARVQLK